MKKDLVQDQADLSSHEENHRQSKAKDEFLPSNEVFWQWLEAAENASRHALTEKIRHTGHGFS